MNGISANSIKRNKLLYTLEATFEYLISILVAGSFLATLTKELGFSDSLTGILSSIISLGCLFQLISLFIRPAQEKRFITVFSILNQLLFMLLYVVPLTRFDRQIKIAVFVAFIFIAYILYNITHPKKISWLMSFVENSHRGRFTANKEIISLLSGIVFSFGMGSVIDHFETSGRIRTAFVICAATIFALMLLHTLSVIFVSESYVPSRAKINLKHTLPQLMKNKNLFRITIVFILYYAATYISTPFYGTYQINELGLSLKYVSAITMCGSISRILVSRFWGKYADKNSFAVMIEKCFIFLAASYICVIFAVPSSGKVLFGLYYLLHGIALGGINSALINLIFDYAPSDKRADLLAITQAFAGLTGFLTTLLASPLVSLIQNNDTKLFGFHIYAQQFVSILGFFITIAAIVFVRTFIIKKSDSVK